jgi:hypothetical protein
MAAKIAFLDRLLATYGPEAADARSLFHTGVKELVKRIWPEEAGLPVRLDANTQTGNALYVAIQNLSPYEETQRKLKDQAASVATDLGQLRSLLQAQSVPSISKPMLVVLVSWLVIIFMGFSILAPSNPTIIFAFIISAVACLWRHFSDPGGGSAV